MAREHVSTDPITGISCYLDFEPGTTRFRIVHEQPSIVAETVLSSNAELRADTDRKRRGIKNSFMHAATIPEIVWLKWKHELNVDIFNPNDDKKVKALLNSPEWQHLKVINGRV